MALVALGECLDKLVGMGHLRRGFHCRLSWLGSAVGNVVEDIPREQRGLLRHQCDLLAPAIQCHIPEVHTTKPNRAGDRVVKAQH